MIGEEIVLLWVVILRSILLFYLFIFGGSSRLIALYVKLGRYGYGHDNYLITSFCE